VKLGREIPGAKDVLFQYPPAVTFKTLENEAGSMSPMAMLRQSLVS
jgi:hypothetical protein